MWQTPEVNSVVLFPVGKFFLLVKIVRRGAAFGWVRLWQVDVSGRVVREGER